MQAQKYPDGDCRRVGAGYKPQTSRGRGHGAWVSNAVGRRIGRFHHAVRSERDGDAEAKSSVGGVAGAGALAAMSLLARIIGRKRAR